MKNAVLLFRTTGKPQRSIARQAALSFQSRKILLSVLTVSIFLVTAQAGLSTLASVSQIAIQIFLEACRFFFIPSENLAPPVHVTAQLGLPQVGNRLVAREPNSDGEASRNRAGHLTHQ